MLEINVILLIFINFTIIRQLLILNNFFFIKSFSQTIVLFLLPVISYYLTSAISGNFSISLAMIGALAIIRFRMAIKNIIELIVYFYSLAVGITIAVSIKLFILIWLIFALTLFFLKIYKLYLVKKNN